MVIHNQKALILVIIVAVLIAVLIFVAYWQTVLRESQEIPGASSPLPSNPIPEAVGNPFGESGAYENPFATPAPGSQPYENPFKNLR